MIFKNISTKHQVSVVKSYWFGQVKKVIDNGLSDSTSIFLFFFSVGPGISYQSLIFLAIKESQHMA